MERERGGGLGRAVSERERESEDVLCEIEREWRERERGGRQ